MTTAPPMGPAVAPPRLDGGKAPRPTDTLRTEWTKLRSVRSTPVTLAVIAVMVVGLSGLITFAVVTNHRHGARVVSDPVGILQSAWFLGLLAFMVLGVLVMTGEYSSGLIGPTLLATPKRLRVLSAKAAVFAVTALVTGEVVSFVNFFVSHAIASGYALFPDPAIGDHNVLRAVIGMGIDAALAGLMGLGLGTLLRSTAWSITTGVAITFVLPLIFSFLPSSWSNPLLEYWPTQAGSQLEEVNRQAHALTAWWGTGDLALFVFLLLAAAGYLLVKRDA
ncbi:MAG: ABC transporter permease [Acidimicrobiales bacterium]